MSITDELRKYVQSWRETPNLMDDLDAGDIDGILADFEHIADRIDAEYERVRAESIIDMTDESMAEHGWIRLPKDADGVPIHVGDEMENLREDLEPQLHHRFRVYSIHYRDYGQVCVLVEDGYPSILYRTDECRHYHAPTVEDVLRDVVTLCHNTWKEESPFQFYDVDDVMESGIITECASKLRLAEEDA